jgi:1,4-alpha-glucan branching enzyme
MIKKTTAALDDIYRIIFTEHHDPFQILGIHSIEIGGKASVVLRAFLPDAVSALVVELKDGKPFKEYPMEKILNEGYFECLIQGRKEPFPYKLKKIFHQGEETVFYDSYSFLPTLTDFDLHLLGKGDHHRLYEKLGAHYLEVQGVGGVQFAVWAPNARSVGVVGDFNQWDRRYHAMRVLGSSGVWEIFIPGLPEGVIYKYQIKTQSGSVVEKADPYGFEMEQRPRTASKVNFLKNFTWTDQDWIEYRKSTNHLENPIAIYELHLGSWARIPEEGNRWLSYTEMAEKIASYVKERGYTHIELLPVFEHPFDGSWGYQVTGYFAPTSRFGSPQDFMYFIDCCHQNNIGVILDWVPAHFPKDGHALGWFDGSNLYEHSDPRKGEQMDWGTLIFNYGRNEVKNFLTSNALFWIEQYHIDGLRIDAVASMLYLDYSRKEGEWIPNPYGGRENIEAIEFLKHLNGVVHHYYPGVLTIAEESTAWPGVTNSLEYGGLGFDLKWNMGWMHDILEYFSNDPVHRKHHQNNLTFALLYAFSERFLLPLSHDEVVHGKSALVSKMPGDDWQKFANLRLLFGFMYAFPGKKLMFMGDEIAQRNEWNHEISLDWHLLEYEPHRGVQHCVDDLNKLYKSERALYQQDFHYNGFQWIDFNDHENSVIAFERKAFESDDVIVVVCNFTPVPRHNYRIGVPVSGLYQELINTDSSYYGGGNMGNSGFVSSEAVPFHGRLTSVQLTLPPLAVIYLKKVE